MRVARVEARTRASWASAAARFTDGSAPTIAIGISTLCRTALDQRQRFAGRRQLTFLWEYDDSPNQDENDGVGRGQPSRGEDRWRPSKFSEEQTAHVLRQI